MLNKRDDHKLIGIVKRKDSRAALPQRVSYRSYVRHGGNKTYGSLSPKITVAVRGDKSVTNQTAHYPPQDDYDPQGGKYMIVSHNNCEPKGRHSYNKTPAHAPTIIRTLRGGKSAENPTVHSPQR